MRFFILKVIYDISRILKDFGSNCVKSWYNEVKKYNFKNPGFAMATGHFTQLVWKSSTRLGLGLAAGKHGRSNAYYCVAEYSPPGNYANEFRENVLPPRSEIEIDESS
jgi:hypothetical protein